jgi:signal transduction histidine kinase/ActR/RegA family two-component response regulator
MRTTSRRTFRELLTGLGALVLAVVVQAAIVWSTIDRLEALDAADDQARAELLHSDAMLYAMLDQAAGMRGLVISGDRQFLQTYEHGRQRFEAGIPRMIALAAEDPPFMRRRVDDIVQQARSWNETVAKPQIAATTAGARLRYEPADKAHIDAIRVDFAILRNEEMRLLQARDEPWRAAFWQSRLTLLLGSGVALIFTMLIAARSLRRLIQQQREAHAAATRLADALDRAHAAQHAKTVFLSNMSHEMRTPLNGVVGMADVLALTDLSAHQQDLLGVIRASATTLDGLIGNLLTLSRGGGEGHSQIRPFSLGDAIREIAAEHRPSAEIKGLRFEAMVDAQAEREVVGDRAQLEQLLSCLLSNAVKFTDRGHIRLTLGSLGAGRRRVQIADTGVGFDQARKAQLFETFSQSDDSATRRHGGAGLGLALARQLASKLGGELDCHSTPGEGSVFTVDIDLPDLVPAGDAAPEAAAAAPTDDAPPRILVVDDHPTNRQVLELILDQVGAEWVSVEDGRQAVDAAALQDFAAILMDIQMPVMDGLTATREIRRQERSAGRAAVPVIIVSANGQPEHVQAGRAAGAQMHLTKPVSAEELVAALNAVLGAPEAAGQAAAA